VEFTDLVALGQIRFVLMYCRFVSFLRQLLQLFPNIAHPAGSQVRAKGQVAETTASLLWGLNPISSYHHMLNSRFWRSAASQLVPRRAGIALSSTASKPHAELRKDVCHKQNLLLKNPYSKGTSSIIHNFDK